jgi:hypothetical protein
MSLPRSMEAVVSRAERGRTGLHSYDGQVSMGNSSASRVHCKEGEKFLQLKMNAVRKKCEFCRRGLNYFSPILGSVRFLMT